MEPPFVDWKIVRCGFLVIRFAVCLVELSAKLRKKLPLAHVLAAKKSSGSFIMIVAGAGGFFTYELMLFNSLFVVVRWSQDFFRRECRSPRTCEEHP